MNSVHREEYLINETEYLEFDSLCEFIFEFYQINNINNMQNNFQFFQISSSNYIIIFLSILFGINKSNKILKKMNLSNNTTTTTSIPDIHLFVAIFLSEFHQVLSLFDKEQK